MVRVQGLLPTVLVASTLALVWAPAVARAGGNEFPGEGTRGLGRGATGFLRADDPTVMTRNPALLADLWGDQAILGAHLLLADACFTPTGAFGWDVNPDDVSDFGDGPVLIGAAEGDTTLDGEPLLAGYADEPFPRICYDGPAPFLPHLGLSMKLSDDLGVGIGFFPPDVASLNQWGNRDGTLDTENGKRPNPLRYYRSHLNVSYVSALGAVGYRLADWIRVGAGLQWNLVVFSATTWTTPAMQRNPRNDVRTDVFGRDLFIPGLIGSVHVVPMEELDVAVGFKWSERVDAKAKLDLTSGAFGTGEIFEYMDDSGTVRQLGSSVPTTTHNQPGFVDTTPIWVPQLSLGVRYAQRLKPRARETAALHEAVDPTVEDHMSTELWDIELNAIVYFNSASDKTAFRSSEAELELTELNPLTPDVPTSFDANVGECLGEEVGGSCQGDRETATLLGGKDHVSLRLGGDYNVLPGLLAVRAGATYETSGQDVEFLNVMNYMLSRVGLHAGATLRVADKTDISIGFAHFIHEDVRLQVNPEGASLPRVYKNEAYNFAPGLGVSGVSGDEPEGSFDGVAQVEVPYGGQDAPGPHFVNAGSYFFDLSVVSLTFSQHF